MKPLRRIPLREKTLFLTFDDGPSESSTGAVLDVLRARKTRASFFLVAERLRAHPALAARIVSDGHAIGNHSTDHDYRRYFAGQASLKSWIADAKSEIEGALAVETIGFRPPAGVRTPPLARALAELSEPMILWNARFFDAVFQWREAAALRALAAMESGAIILLHDRQSPRRLPRFLTTLDLFISEAQRRGFAFAPLRRDVCIDMSKSLGNA